MTVDTAGHEAEWPDGRDSTGPHADLAAVKVSDSSDRDWQERRDQDARLWSHVLHRDALFVQRCSFFLVTESLLVVAYSAVLTKGLSSSRTISIFGLLLTLIWVHVNNRQRSSLEHLENKARETFPEYELVCEERKFPGPRITGTWLMTFVVPGLAAIMWLMFVIIAF